MVSVSEIVQYLQEVKIETKKVVFPKRKDTLMTTYAVLVFVLIIAIILAMFDWGLSAVTKTIIK